MEFMIPISLFAMIVAIVYLSNRRKERMAIIERGLDPRYLSAPGNDDQLINSLKYGLLLLFLGVGLLVANVLVSADIMDEAPAYFSLGSLSVGLALLFNYFLASRLKRKEEQEEKQD